MSRDRWFRIEDDVAAFDWERPARARDIPLETAHALYLRAMRFARDARSCETLYLRWLHESVVGPAPVPLPVPGRRTRAMCERDGVRPPRSSDLDRLGPGKWTRSLREIDRNDERDDDHGAALPADLVARLAPHVGTAAARAARLHIDETAAAIAASHRARALTIGTDIFFARGEYAPGTAGGDELLVHELTHVAQGQRGELFRAAAKGIDSGGALDPAEAEAELRARLAVVALHPPDTAAPALAAPAGQPMTPDDRAARLLAQQQRIALANEPVAPLVEPPAPPAATPQAPVPNAAPAMTSLAAPVPASNAYSDTFQALPSKQAMELWATAGTRATTQAVSDQARFVASLPAMPVVLVGVAEPAVADGGSGAQSTNDMSSTPADAPADAAAGQPAAAPATPEQIAQQTAAALAAIFAASPSGNTAQSQAQAQAQAQADGQRALDALPTTAPDVSTDPGAAPMTDLAGQADPVRTLGDHQQAITAGAAALDDARTAIVTGPGAAQVQPLRLDEKLPVPPAQDLGALPALPTIDGMARFKTWSLPGDAQASFDEVARPRMEANLAQAKAQMTQAETTRDLDRARAISDAQDKVKQAHADADQQQQSKVAETRTRIVNQQADALLQHEAEVKKLDQTAGTRKTSTITRINDRITADQTKVDNDFKDAQQRADDRKKQGEDEAAQKKQDAQDRAANQSWWDQLVGAISDAIQSIADEITRVLDGIATAIAEIIDEVKTAACQLIDAARDFVCQALTEFGDWLKSQVDALLGSVFPELAAALDRLIDQAVADATTAVNAIADGLKDGVTALCDGLKTAIDGVIAAFKAAVEAAATFAQAALTGDWDLVAKMILDGILAALGIDPAAFYALIGTAREALETIVADPGAFVGHLVDAVKLGFRQFGDNFWTHLQGGLVEWLTGTLSGAGIQMPASFDLAGIFDLVCQVLGLTWPRLRLKVVGVIGEQNTERLEAVAGYLEALVTGGFAGLWERVQQDLSNLWDMVVGGIRDWLIQNVVQQAILKLATMWNPVGAIFQLIQTAWNAYQWLRDNAQRIFGLVEAVVTSISNIAAGDIGGAANFIEASLARLVPIAISLFADLIGLGGIADEIQRIIGQVQTAIDEAIDALIQRVMAMFTGGGDQPDGGEDEPGPEDEWWRARQTFTAESGETHTLLFVGEGPGAVLTIHSVERPLAEYVARLRAVLDDPAEQAQLGPARGTAGDEATVSGLQESIAQQKTRIDRGREVPKYAGYDGAEVNRLLLEMAAILGTLRDPDSPTELPGVRPASVIAYARPHVTPMVGDMRGPSEDGKGVEAKLTSVPGSEVGSMASYRSTLYAALDARRGVAITPAHLLNHHLYGSGASAENIAPVTKSVNNSMSSGIENIAKAMVFNDNKAVHYSVTVNWPDNPGSRGGQDSLDEDRQLPESVVVAVKEYTFNEAAFAGATEAELTRAMSDWRNWTLGGHAPGSPATYTLIVPNTPVGASRLERVKAEIDATRGTIGWIEFRRKKNLDRNFSAEEIAELQAYFQQGSGGTPPP